MPGRVPFLIVGGGQAGARAAEALRQEGAGGEIVVLSADADRPYNRPPLSKDFLRDETKRDDLFIHPPDWATKHDVRLRTGTTAEALDVRHRTVTLTGGEKIEFERLLLATGSAPRHITIPGADLDGVYLLRTLADAERIKRAAAGKRHAVLIGGGFIGAEVAASLMQIGVTTTVIAREHVLWEHLFGPDVARVFHHKLQSKGVYVAGGDTAAQIAGHGHAQRVITAGGQTLQCDFVVVGIGATPRLKLTQGTPLKVTSGVVTDEFLQTSEPGIYAAGDIARFYSRLYERHLRVEHWDLADKHGRIAGQNMAREAAGPPHRRTAFDEPPYFFSDLFDLSMEYLGSNEGWDGTVMRGDVNEEKCTTFYLRGGRLVAALSINRNEDVEPAKLLIKRRLQVDPSIRRALADPKTDLAALAKTSSRREPNAGKAAA
jgi:3-phenylpropionate/trans-cinnamate dioxygenase ferredoxin reductase component